MRRLQGALIGFGFIAEKGHLPAYQAASLDLIAIADTNAARRQLARVAFPNARIYDGHEALLAAEARNLDFIDIATPPYMHAQIAHAALDAGLHVLCEKPMAVTADEARSMIEHALRAKRVLFPSHNYKHAPVIRAVAKILDEGTIGKVHHVTLDTFRNTHARGVKEWKESWRREKKFSGGGIAMDHGSHTFYLAFDWLQSYPTSITAKMSTAAESNYDTEDTFSAHIQFPTGTAVAQLTWRAGIRKVIYTIHGEKGAIRVEDDDVEVSVMDDPNGKPVTWKVTEEKIASDWMDASHTIWFRSLFERFQTAIDTHDYAGKDAQDALRCVELINAAYASAADQSRERVLSGSDAAPPLAPPSVRNVRSINVKPANGRVNGSLHTNGNSVNEHKKASLGS
ncbi:MAG: Gfo/Idh/MocA family oxidoreductase [Polyangiaceae bacterium]